MHVSHSTQRLQKIQHLKASDASSLDECRTTQNSLVVGGGLKYIPKGRFGGNTILYRNFEQWSNHGTHMDNGLTTQPKILLDRSQPASYERSALHLRTTTDLNQDQIMNSHYTQSERKIMKGYILIFFLMFFSRSDVKNLIFLKLL